MATMTDEQRRQYHRRKSKEWRLDPGNKEHRKQYLKIWRSKNKDRVKDYSKKYMKTYYENHKKELSEKRKIYWPLYWAQNRDKIIEKRNNKHNKNQ